MDLFWYSWIYLCQAQPVGSRIYVWVTSHVFSMFDSHLQVARRPSRSEGSLGKVRVSWQQLMITWRIIPGLVSG